MYIKDKLLGKNEEILFIAEKNPVFLILDWAIGGFIFLILFLLGIIATMFYSWKVYYTQPFLIVGILFFVASIIPIIRALQYTFDFKTTEFVITNRKVIQKSGWLSIRSDETFLNKIEDISIRTSFWGGLLNYGTIRFSAGLGTGTSFRYIKNVTETKRIITDIIFPAPELEKDDTTSSFPIKELVEE